MVRTRRSAGAQKESMKSIGMERKTRRQIVKGQQKRKRGFEYLLGL